MGADAGAHRQILGRGRAGGTQQKRKKDFRIDPRRPKLFFVVVVV